MAWDIQVDNESGDLVFSPSRDIAGVSGAGLLRQRVSIRCKIPRGTYLYDLDGDLGSNLYLVPRSPSLAQVEDAKAAIVAALEPMGDEIEIHEITFTTTENNQLQSDIVFMPIMTDPDVPTVEPYAEPEYDAISLQVTQDSI